MLLATDLYKYNLTPTKNVAALIIKNIEDPIILPYTLDNGSSGLFNIFIVPGKNLKKRNHTAIVPKTR